ncbi:MAG: DUF1176 domain-containing protein [Rhizobiaceae bacterium]
MTAIPRPAAFMLASCLALASTVVAPAGEPASPPFVDDRSDAAAVIRSLYSAVNRREYARAWSYFSTPPSKSYEAFVNGYGATTHVDVVTGRPIAEGAAGSIYYLVPVAIRSTGPGEKENVFAGCYTVRQVNPQIQEPPFRPMAIEKGALKPVAFAHFLENEIPEDCDGETATEETPAELKERVARLFTTTRRADCNLIEDSRPYVAGDSPEIHIIEFRYDESDPNDQVRKATLFRFACARYAYNVAEVYYLVDHYGVVTTVSLPEPVLDIVYTDDSNEKVKSMTIAGYESRDLAVNSEFDPGTRTITTFGKWRGIGDAFSAGVWTFRGGRFVLTSYEADAAYDGEQDPVSVFNAAQ